ncbi:MAG: UpxY family transcription antiterminator [Chitinophagaceae bacterium]
MSNKKWYAVYTKPRWEKKVAESLTTQQIENYCPLNRVQRQWSDRRKTILEPLFKSYVFVRIEEDGQMPVREIDGVLNFVTWLRKPAVIRNEEIEVIKRFLNEHSNVKVEATQVNLNDKVRIISGPLMMREGNVLEVKHKTVKVLLPSLGFTLVAEIEKGNVEKALLQ